MRTARITAAAVAAFACIAAGPVAVAAAGDDRVEHVPTFTEGPFTTVHEPCGAVENMTLTVRDTNFWDDDGNLVRSIEHFLYESVVTGPNGKSISLQAHQTFEFENEIVTLTGQGATIRAPGHGVLYQDVGRLVTDVSGPFPGVTLLASAKSVSFAAADPDKLSAAICTAVE
jgi:hypothetical protein